MTGGVRKRGNNWYYYFDLGKVNGKRKKIERKGGSTKKEAQAALRKALQEYENAGLLFEPSEISVSDYMDYWVKNYVEMNCKYNTIQGYKRIITNHIKPIIGSYKLKSISPVILQQFVNEKATRGFTKNYLVNIISVLSGSFRAAVYPYKFIKENPMQYIKLPKNENIRVQTNRKIITQVEFKQIIERFPKGNTFYIPLQIAYHTGTRVGECCALTWDDIDLENKVININRILIKKEKKQWYFGSTKTKSSVRTIPIGQTLTDILRTHKKWQIENRLKCGKFYNQYCVDKNDRIYSVDGTKDYKATDDQVHFVCTREGGELVTTETIRYCSRIINYELMIQFNFHALRHTHATLLIENGANMKDVQERLGHSRLATTMDTYTHATDSMSKNTVDIFEKLCHPKTI
ncbi:site-specific integrase [Vallitalea sp.]|jgi:integrase|uniref:site-specific integrase n=1 Tax=Vallitalea sp. TaxID=1882829 RepID=UPI0025F6BA79|nr:site-specific integrase [Vallitalea sp.]MCT4686600.1 site-specific integrase [Vallitalea sp.]